MHFGNLGEITRECAHLSQHHRIMVRSFSALLGSFAYAARFDAPPSVDRCFESGRTSGDEPAQASASDRGCAIRLGENDASKETQQSQLLRLLLSVTVASGPLRLLAGTPSLLTGGI